MAANKLTGEGRRENAMRGDLGWLRLLDRLPHQLRQGEGMAAGSREQYPRHQKCQRVTDDLHGES